MMKMIKLMGGSELGRQEHERGRNLMDEDVDESGLESVRRILIQTYPLSFLFTICPNVL